MMVREQFRAVVMDHQGPIEDYSNVANKIISMLYGIDELVYCRKRSIGVRLEDLKNNHTNNSSLVQLDGYRRQ